MTDIVTARFRPGQIVYHRRDAYRAVVVDVDAEYNGSSDWYQSRMDHQPTTVQPWYHLLVDGADYATYAPEADLESDPSADPVEHPWLENFFHAFHPEAGRYQDRYPRM